MSLTSLIRKPQINDLFREHFPLPNVSLVSPIYIAPRTENYALVGTAFDHLFRFYLGELNKTLQGRWIAEYAPGSKAREIIVRSKADIRNNQKDRWPEDALRLARLDQFYRQGSYTTVPLSKKDIEDLKALIDIVDWRRFKISRWKRGKCRLNPTFGMGSSLVGGADADFIIGNLLVDIKTTKYLEIKEEYYKSKLN